MGFLSSSSHLGTESDQDTTLFQEEYIRRTIRQPSVRAKYSNPIFELKFKNLQEVMDDCTTALTKQTPDTPKTRRRFRFRELFRKKTREIDLQSTCQDSNKENITPPVTDEYHDAIDDECVFNNTDIPLQIGKIPGTNFEIYEDGDENSSLQVSTFLENTPKRRLTLRRLFRKNPKEELDLNDTQDTNTIKATFKERLFGLKKTPLEGKDPTAGNDLSVFDVQETLTQKYMGNEDSYERLMKDIDAIPFDLTVKEDTSIQYKLAQAVHSLSPKKSHYAQETERASSMRFKSQQQVERCNEVDSWNPYDTAKRVREIDAISLHSSDYELAEKNDVKIGKQRPSRMVTFVRRLSIRRPKRRSIQLDNFSIAKLTNNSMESVNFVGNEEKQHETLRLWKNISTIRTNEVHLKDSQNLDLYPNFVTTKFFESPAPSNKDQPSFATSSETVVDTEQTPKHRISAFKKAELKSSLSRNNSFSFSGGTNVEPSHLKLFSDDVSSFISSSTKMQFYTKEPTESGNVNFYSQLTIQPMAVDVNNENVTTVLSELEETSNSKHRPKGINMREGFKTLSRRNSLSPFDISNASNAARSRPTTAADGKKTFTKRPHTSSSAPVKEDNSQNCEDSDEKNKPYTCSLLSGNQSHYSENGNFTWNITDLEIEKEGEDNDLNLGELKGLVMHNKKRHREELRRPYTGQL